MFTCYKPLGGDLLRELFIGFYRPSEEEFNKLWDECIFVFDANVLLNLYRYTTDTQEGLLKVLNAFKERIWLPNRAVNEYFKNRLKVISEQSNAYSEIIGGITSYKNSLQKHKRHLTIDIDKITDIISYSEEQINELLDISKGHDNDYSKSDIILEQIIELFNGKVGKPFPDDELSKLYEVAEKRFDNKIPPGYEDRKIKKDERKYSDYVIWKQIIDYAKSNNRPIIIVTDDKKEDWWLEFKGQKISPRPELINEFYCETNLLCYIYESEIFLEYANKYLGFEEQEKAIKEIRGIKQFIESEEHKKQFERKYVINGYHRILFQKKEYNIVKTMVNWFLDNYDIPNAKTKDDVERYDISNVLNENFQSASSSQLVLAKNIIMTYGDEWIKIDL